MTEPRSDDPRVRAGETKRRRTRARLIAAASEVIREDGVAVRMERVAERAGVSLATLYNFFPGRGEMFRQVCWDTVVEPLAEYVYEAVSQEPDRWKVAHGYLKRFQPAIKNNLSLFRGMLVDRLEATERTIEPAFDCVDELALHYAACSFGENFWMRFDGSMASDQLRTQFRAAVVATIDGFIFSPRNHIDFVGMIDIKRFSTMSPDDPEFMEKIIRQF